MEDSSSAEAWPNSTGETLTEGSAAECVAAAASLDEEDAAAAGLSAAALGASEEDAEVAVVAGSDFLASAAFENDSGLGSAAFEESDMICARQCRESHARVR
jgi:hypothetical protein